MNNYSKFDQMIVNHANFLLKWRWPLLILILVAVGISASGARFLGFATDYRVFFSDENPQLNAFDEIQEIYTKNDNILFLLEPQDGNPFSQEYLSTVKELTAEAWKIPYAIRVDAVTNFQYTYADGDDLVVADLVLQPDQLTEDELTHVRKIALTEPQLVNRLVSNSGHVTGINVTFQLPGETIDEVPEVAAYARKLKAEIAGDNPKINFYMTGIVMLNNAYVEGGMNDMSSLVPLMYLAIIVILILLLRSFSSTFATLLMIAFSVASAIGLAGWAGILLTPPSASAPTMIMTLSVADSIHLLVTMLKEMRRGLSKREAIIESLRINAVPIFLTSLTTVIGFLSMNFSDSPPFHDLGNITATGVMIAFFLSITFLPIIMSFLPVKVKVTEQKERKVFDRLADIIFANRKSVVFVSVLFIGAMTFLISNNELDEKWTKYFDESVEFRTDTDFVTNNLAGMYQIDHSIGSGEDGGISNPDYLNKLDQFAAWYESQPEVVHVNSLTTTIKRLNMNMHGDDSAYYTIPDDRDLIAQYLLLYEMSLPYGLDINNQININKSSTRFTATIKDISSNRIKLLEERANAWLLENFPSEMNARGTGPAVVFAHIVDRNIKGLLTGTFLALILITIALTISLKSIKFGLLSIFPNVIPAVLGFGIWAILDGEVNLALMMVIGMTLGIVVDDTVHFLSKYLRARREKKLSPEDSVRYTFDTVGTALVVTTVVLVIGFAILSLSPFKMNSDMGKMTAITITFALIADFILLPVLLMAIDKRASIKLKQEKQINNITVLSTEIVEIKNKGE